MQRRRAVVGAVLVALIVAGLFYSLHKRLAELPVYTTGGARMAAGAEIYRVDDAKPFTYPPFFAVPFMPLAALSERSQRAVFYLANVGALLVVIALLVRRLRPFLPQPGTRAPPLALFWLLVVLLGGRHVSAVFENQSHDLLVLLPLMAGIAASMRGAEIASGAWIGIAAACKATPLLFLAVFIGQGRFRAALALAAAAVAATMLPDALFPRSDGGSWGFAWARTFLTGLEVGRPAEAEGAWNAWNLLNQNLAGAVYRLSTPIATGEHTFDVSLWNPGPDAVRVVTIAVQLGILALLAFAARPGLSRGLSVRDLQFRRLGEAGAVVCGMVLLSPMSSKSHFCVLIVPAAFCLVEVLYRRRRPWVIAWLVAAFVLGALTTRGLVGRTLGRELLARGSVAWSTLCLLIATVSILMREGGRREGSGDQMMNGSSPHSVL